MFTKNLPQKTTNARDASRARRRRNIADMSASNPNNSSAATSNPLQRTMSMSQLPTKNQQGIPAKSNMHFVAVSPSPPPSIPILPDPRPPTLHKPKPVKYCETVDRGSSPETMSLDEEWSDGYEEGPARARSEELDAGDGVDVPSSPPCKVKSNVGVSQHPTQATGSHAAGLSSTVADAGPSAPSSSSAAPASRQPTSQYRQYAFGASCGPQDPGQLKERAVLSSATAGPSSFEHPQHAYASSSEVPESGNLEEQEEQEDPLQPFRDEVEWLKEASDFRRTNQVSSLSEENASDELMRLRKRVAELEASHMKLLSCIDQFIHKFVPHLIAEQKRVTAELSNRVTSDQELQERQYKVNINSQRAYEQARNIIKLISSEAINAAYGGLRASNKAFGAVQNLAESICHVSPQLRDELAEQWRKFEDHPTEGSDDLAPRASSSAGDAVTTNGDSPAQAPGVSTLAGPRDETTLDSTHAEGALPTGIANGVSTSLDSTTGPGLRSILRTSVVNPTVSGPGLVTHPVGAAKMSHFANSPVSAVRTSAPGVVPAIKTPEEPVGSVVRTKPVLNRQPLPAAAHHKRKRDEDDDTDAPEEQSVSLFERIARVFRPAPRKKPRLNTS